MSNEQPYQGYLGRTTRVSVLVSNNSGDAFNFDTYRSINITKNPELLDQIQTGALFDATCPLTDDVFRLASPLVVHDEEAKTLALLVPDALRHKTLQLRQDVLQELNKSAEKIPAYALNFQTVFDLDQVKSGDESAHDTSELEIEKAQLADIRERFDREREQMDDLQEQLQSERAAIERAKEELELERQNLAAEMLNRESQLIQQSHGIETSEPVEETQIVTDDQFLEVMDEADASPELLAEASEFADIGDDFELTNSQSGLPATLKELVSGGSRRAVKVVNEQVVAVAQIGATDLKKLSNANAVFLQLHDVEQYPVVALMIATLNDSGQIESDVSWPLDPADDADLAIINMLQKAVQFRVGLYDSAGKLAQGIKVQAPLSSNATWIADEAARRLDSQNAPLGGFSTARNTFLSNSFERLGNMKHNFTRSSFEDADTPSAVKLAAGIVGYWSTPDMFEYLIANRGFPLHHFREVQGRVIERAANYGIYLNDALRRRAVESGVAASEHALAELMVANFAEVSVALKKNDLDHVAQWENWDALLTLGESLGIPPDPDVVELAEASLKRAQDSRDIASSIEQISAADEPTMSIREDLVVEKQSESTGVTYYLPNDAVLDSFDDLSELPREDLEKLLGDENSRLEAAQMLIEKYGSAATDVVMERLDDWSESEIQALAMFFETKADGLEGDLVRAMESGGPGATYIAARALSAIKSTSAIPALLDAIGDPKRVSDPDVISGAMSNYGTKLVPALTRAIKTDGPKPHFISLLSRLEDHASGTLAEMSKDRSKHLREASKKARHMRDAK